MGPRRHPLGQGRPPPSLSLPPHSPPTHPGEAYNDIYKGDYHLSRKEKRWAATHWHDEEFYQIGRHQQDEFVLIDAHILTTPTIGDIDDDGHEELVVAVSYFFDREYYEAPEHALDLKG